MSKIENIALMYIIVFFSSTYKQTELHCNPVQLLGVAELKATQLIRALSARWYPTAIRTSGRVWFHL